MSTIEVYSTGGGTAWVDNPNPTAGEYVTLYAEPFAGATLDDIVAYTENQEPIAIYVQEEQTFLWEDQYFHQMFIYVTFSEPKIHVYVNGNGSAYVTNEYPSVSEVVTLYIDPAPSFKVLSVIGYDENGNAVRFSNRKIQSFMWTYQTLDIYITIRVDNNKEKGMPIWMYPRLRKCFT